MFAARVFRRDISKLTLIVIPHLAVIFNERGRLKMEGAAKSDRKKTGDITYLTCWFIVKLCKFKFMRFKTKTYKRKMGKNFSIMWSM